MVLTPFCQKELKRGIVGSFRSPGVSGNKQFYPVLRDRIWDSPDSIRNDGDGSPCKEVRQ